MGSHPKRYALLVSLFCLICQPSHASTWNICRMQLHITKVVKQPYPKLRAQVLKASPTTTGAQCPKTGVTIEFIPETADYQNTLPRRQWPKEGQSVNISYRYLDGSCKGDGHNYECRIEHYPFSDT
nr:MULTISPECIES: hypothetical protein [unclassified Pseudomonas]